MSKGSFHCTTGMIVYVWRFCGLGRANRYSSKFGLRYNYQISGGSMWCTQCGLATVWGAEGVPTYIVHFYLPISKDV